MEKRFITLKEMCDYLNVCYSTAYKMIRSNKGFGIQIGSKWYADKIKLDKWIEKQTK